MGDKVKEVGTISANPKKGMTLGCMILCLCVVYIFSYRHLLGLFIE